jgi:hypothetical protein
MIGTIIYRTLALLFLAAIAGFLLMLAFPGVRGGAGFTEAIKSTPNPPAALIAPADVVTIVLTAATLVLAGVAIVISLLAVVGYEQMRRMVETKATTVANERLDAHIKAMQQEAVEAGGLGEGADSDRMAAAFAEPSSPVAPRLEDRQ